MTNELHDTGDDRTLITRCAAGDAGAWDEFVQRYRRVIRGVAQAVRERQGAWRIEVDDMAGHTYECLLRDECKRLRQWRGEASFRTFLVHLTNNACID